MQNITNTEIKASLLKDIVDWELLEYRLGHHFKQKSAPPLRLLVGLLYIKSMSDASYEMTIEQWNHSPLLQKFCGDLQSDSNYPIRPSTLSIWNRVLGDTGIDSMIAAITHNLNQRLNANPPLHAPYCYVSPARTKSPKQTSPGQCQRSAQKSPF